MTDPARLPFVDLAPEPADLLTDILAGLSASPKTLPCSWLYDAEGARLFSRICELPEYYPTRVELDLLGRFADEIAAEVGPGDVVIELGSGDARKTPRLLAALEEPAGYVAVDISRECLLDATRRVARRFPRLPCAAVCADYMRPIALPPGIAPAGPRIGFFPGSTIGNLDPAAARVFLERVRRLLGRRCWLIVGVDPTHDPDVLVPAYADAAGVTARFNLNLLARLNRELGADFDLSEFAHEARYDPGHERVEMHLVSLRDQTVTVCGSCFRFAAGESIHTESSYKYSVESFRRLARSAGWSPHRVWQDAQGRFCVHLLAAAA